MSVRVKLAYGDEDAKKVLSAVRKRYIPRSKFKEFVSRSIKPLEELGVPSGVVKDIGRSMVKLPMAIVKPKRIKKMQRKGIEFLERSSSNIDPTVANKSLQKYIDTVNKIGLSSGGVFRSRGNVAGSMSSAVSVGNPKKGKLLREAGLKTPEHHRMLESIIKGHELDEIRVKPALRFRNLGHLSPDVILREHNKVTTLGSEHGPVKKFMKSLRKDTKESDLIRKVYPSFSYGESPRLSRHTRKKIVNLLESTMTTKDFLDGLT